MVDEQIRAEHVLLAYFTGKPMYFRLAKLATERQEELIEMVLSGIDRAIEMGGFEVDRAPDDRRTGFDEQHNLDVNRRMQRLIGKERYGKVLDRARDRNVSNVTMFRLGVEGALDRGMI